MKVFRFTNSNRSFLSASDPNKSGMAMKLDSLLCYVFVSSAEFLGPDRAERSIAFLSDFELTDQ